MSDQLELYSNVERKRELVERLEKILTQQLDATEVLDNKAWELLKISSATFGIVATLEITLTGSNVNSLFWQALGIILLCYVAQTVLIILVVRPRKWGLVPGVPDGKPLFNTLLPNSTMSHYIVLHNNRKISDTNNPSHIRTNILSECD